MNSSSSFDEIVENFLKNLPPGFTLGDALNSGLLNAEELRFIISYQAARQMEWTGWFGQPGPWQHPMYNAQPFQLAMEPRMPYDYYGGPPRPTSYCREGIPGHRDDLLQFQRYGDEDLRGRPENHRFPDNNLRDSYLAEVRHDPAYDYDYERRYRSRGNLRSPRSRYLQSRRRGRDSLYLDDVWAPASSGDEEFLDEQKSNEENKTAGRQPFTFWNKGRRRPPSYVRNVGEPKNSTKKTEPKKSNEAQSKDPKPSASKPCDEKSKAEEEESIKEKSDIAVKETSLEKPKTQSKDPQTCDESHKVTENNLNEKEKSTVKEISINLEEHNLGTNINDKQNNNNKIKNLTCLNSANNGVKDKNKTELCADKISESETTKDQNLREKDVLLDNEKIVSCLSCDKEKSIEQKETTKESLTEVPKTTKESLTDGLHKTDPTQDHKKISDTRESFSSSSSHRQEEQCLKEIIKETIAPSTNFPESINNSNLKSNLEDTEIIEEINNNDSVDFTKEYKGETCNDKEDQISILAAEMPLSIPGNAFLFKKELRINLIRNDFKKANKTNESLIFVDKVIQISDDESDLSDLEIVDVENSSDPDSLKTSTQVNEIPLLGVGEVTNAEKAPSKPKEKETTSFLHTLQKDNYYSSLSSVEDVEEDLLTDNNINTQASYLYASRPSEVTNVRVSPFEDPLSGTIINTHASFLNASKPLELTIAIPDNTNVIDMDLEPSPKFSSDEEEDLERDTAFENDEMFKQMDALFQGSSQQETSAAVTSDNTKVKKTNTYLPDISKVVKNCAEIRLKFLMNKCKTIDVNHLVEKAQNLRRKSEKILKNKKINQHRSKSVPASKENNSTKIKRSTMSLNYLNKIQTINVSCWKPYSTTKTDDPINYNLKQDVDPAKTENDLPEKLRSKNSQGNKNAANYIKAVENLLDNYKGDYKDDLLELLSSPKQKVPRKDSDCQSKIKSIKFDSHVTQHTEVNQDKFNKTLNNERLEEDTDDEFNVRKKSKKIDSSTEEDDKVSNTTLKNEQLEEDTDDDFNVTKKCKKIDSSTEEDDNVSSQNKHKPARIKLKKLQSETKEISNANLIDTIMSDMDRMRETTSKVDTISSRRNSDIFDDRIRTSKEFDILNQRTFQNRSLIDQQKYQKEPSGSDIGTPEYGRSPNARLLITESFSRRRSIESSRRQSKESSQSRRSSMDNYSSESQPRASTSSSNKPCLETVSLVENVEEKEQKSKRKKLTKKQQKQQKELFGDDSDLDSYSDGEKSRRKKMTASRSRQSTEDNQSQRRVSDEANPEKSTSGVNTKHASSNITITQEHDVKKHKETDTDSDHKSSKKKNSVSVSPKQVTKNISSPNVSAEKCNAKEKQSQSKTGCDLSNSIAMPIENDVNVSRNHNKKNESESKKNIKDDDSRLKTLKGRSTDKASTENDNIKSKDLPKHENLGLANNTPISKSDLDQTSLKQPSGLGASSGDQLGTEKNNIKERDSFKHKSFGKATKAPEEKYKEKKNKNRETKSDLDQRSLKQTKTLEINLTDKQGPEKNSAKKRDLTKHESRGQEDNRTGDVKNQKERNKKKESESDSEQRSSKQINLSDVNPRKLEKDNGIQLSTSEGTLSEKAGREKNDEKKRDSKKHKRSKNKNKGSDSDSSHKSSKKVKISDASQRKSTKDDGSQSEENKTSVKTSQFTNHKNKSQENITSEVILKICESPEPKANKNPQENRNKETCKPAVLNPPLKLTLKKIRDSPYKGNEKSSHVLQSPQTAGTSDSSKNKSSKVTIDLTKSRVKNAENTPISQKASTSSSNEVLTKNIDQIEPIPKITLVRVPDKEKRKRSDDDGRKSKKLKTASCSPNTSVRSNDRGSGQIKMLQLHNFLDIDVFQFAVALTNSDPIPEYETARQTTVTDNPYVEVATNHYPQSIMAQSINMESGDDLYLIEPNYPKIDLTGDTSERSENSQDMTLELFQEEPKPIISDEERICLYAVIDSINGEFQAVSASIPGSVILKSALKHEETSEIINQNIENTNNSNIKEEKDLEPTMNDSNINTSGESNAVEICASDIQDLVEENSVGLLNNQENNSDSNLVDLISNTSDIIACTTSNEYSSVPLIKEKENTTTKNDGGTEARSSECTLSLEKDVHELLSNLERLSSAANKRRESNAFSSNESEVENIIAKNTTSKEILADKNSQNITQASEKLVVNQNTKEAVSQAQNSKTIPNTLTAENKSSPQYNENSHLSPNQVPHQNEVQSRLLSNNEQSNKQVSPQQNEHKNPSLNQVQLENANQSNLFSNHKNSSNQVSLQCSENKNPTPNHVQDQNGILSGLLSNNKHSNNQLHSQHHKNTNPNQNEVQHLDGMESDLLSRNINQNQVQHQVSNYEHKNNQMSPSQNKTGNPNQAQHQNKILSDSLSNNEHSHNQKGKKPHKISSSVQHSPPKMLRLKSVEQINGSISINVEKPQINTQQNGTQNQSSAKTYLTAPETQNVSPTHAIPSQLNLNVNINETQYQQISYQDVVMTRQDWQIFVDIVFEKIYFVYHVFSANYACYKRIKMLQNNPKTPIVCAYAFKNELDLTARHMKSTINSMGQDLFKNLERLKINNILDTNDLYSKVTSWFITQIELKLKESGLELAPACIYLFIFAIFDLQKPTGCLTQNLFIFNLYERSIQYWNTLQHRGDSEDINVLLGQPYPWSGEPLRAQSAGSMQLAGPSHQRTRVETEVQSRQQNSRKNVVIRPKKQTQPLGQLNVQITNQSNATYPSGVANQMHMQPNRITNQSNLSQSYQETYQSNNNQMPSLPVANNQQNNWPTQKQLHQNNLVQNVPPTMPSNQLNINQNLQMNVRPPVQINQQNIQRAMSFNQSSINQNLQMTVRPPAQLNQYNLQPTMPLNQSNMNQHLQMTVRPSLQFNQPNLGPMEKITTFSSQSNMNQNLNTYSTTSINQLNAGQTSQNLRQNTQMQVNRHPQTNMGQNFNTQQTMWSVNQSNMNQNTPIAPTLVVPSYQQNLSNNSQMQDPRQKYSFNMSQNFNAHPVRHSYEGNLVQNPQIVPNPSSSQMQVTTPLYHSNMGQNLNTQHYNRSRGPPNVELLPNNFNPSVSLNVIQNDPTRLTNISQNPQTISNPQVPQNFQNLGQNAQMIVTPQIIQNLSNLQPAAPLPTASFHMPAFPLARQKTQPHQQSKQLNPNPGPIENLANMTVSGTFWPQNSNQANSVQATAKNSSFAAPRAPPKRKQQTSPKKRMDTPRYRPNTDVAPNQRIVYSQPLENLGNTPRYQINYDQPSNQTTVYSGANAFKKAPPPPYHDAVAQKQNDDLLKELLQSSQPPGGSLFNTPTKEKAVPSFNTASSVSTINPSDIRATTVDSEASSCSAEGSKQKGHELNIALQSTNNSTANIPSVTSNSTCPVETQAKTSTDQSVSAPNTEIMKIGEVTVTRGKSVTPDGIHADQNLAQVTISKVSMTSASQPQQLLTPPTVSPILDCPRPPTSISTIDSTALPQPPQVSTSLHVSSNPVSSRPVATSPNSTASSKTQVSISSTVSLTNAVSQRPVASPLKLPGPSSSSTSASSKTISSAEKETRKARKRQHSEDVNSETPIRKSKIFDGDIIDVSSDSEEETDNQPSNETLNVNKLNKKSEEIITGRLHIIETKPIIQKQEKGCDTNGDGKQNDTGLSINDLDDEDSYFVEGPEMIGIQNDLDDEDSTFVEGPEVPSQNVDSCRIDANRTTVDFVLPTIDLTLVPDFDLEQVQKDLGVVFVKKEEDHDPSQGQPPNKQPQETTPEQQAQIREQELSDVVPQQNENVIAPSPSDSGIASPPVQDGLNEDVGMAEEDKFCFCGNKAQYNCVCELSWYCGEDCQFADWENHKQQCSYKPEEAEDDDSDEEDT